MNDSYARGEYDVGRREAEGSIAAPPMVWLIRMAFILWHVVFENLRLLRAVYEYLFLKYIMSLLLAICFNNQTNKWLVMGSIWHYNAAGNRLLRTSQASRHEQQC